MFKFEQEMCRDLIRLFRLSREDSETMQQEYGVPEVFDVPTGVDVEFFRPNESVEQIRSILSLPVLWTGCQTKMEFGIHRAGNAKGQGVIT